ncbi:MAG: hypothetical protein WD227_09100 [Vicinamibacterales bacterium]
MSMQERINSANARSRRVPAVIFKVILAWFLSGIVLALLVPVLHARGIELSHWIVWPVILASTALCLGGEIRSAVRGRD